MSVDQLTNKILHFDKCYRIGVYFVGIDFKFQNNYTQKTNNLVHTLFLNDSQNFNPAKYTPYTV